MYLVLYYDALHDLHVVSFFFFNDTATTEIYTLSLHHALPISGYLRCLLRRDEISRLLLRDWGSTDSPGPRAVFRCGRTTSDRKSTRLNSSHANISYAVFCLKKKSTHPLTSFDTVVLHHRITTL